MDEWKCKLIMCLTQVWKAEAHQAAAAAAVVVVLAPSATLSRATLMPSLKSFSVDGTLSASSLAVAMEAWMRTWTLTTLLDDLGWGAEWAGSLAPSAPAWAEWAATAALWRSSRTPPWCMISRWRWRKFCPVAQRKWRSLESGLTPTGERYAGKTRSWRCRSRRGGRRERKSRSPRRGMRRPQTFQLTWCLC